MTCFMFKGRHTQTFCDHEENNFHRLPSEIREEEEEEEDVLHGHI